MTIPIIRRRVSRLSSNLDSRLLIHGTNRQHLRIETRGNILEKDIVGPIRHRPQNINPTNLDIITGPNLRPSGKIEIMPVPILLARAPRLLAVAAAVVAAVAAAVAAAAAALNLRRLGVDEQAPSR